MSNECSPHLCLGRNIKAKKVIAEHGDLIIATLHTNNGNGLFGIADREYICPSQIVATINADIVPPEYIIQALRREFPRQLIPTDLVDRETFTVSEILKFTCPKLLIAKDFGDYSYKLTAYGYINKKRAVVSHHLPFESEYPIHIFFEEHTNEILTYWS